MNLHKKCHRCGEFFPVKLMSLKFFCNKEECRERGKYSFYHIKRTRNISLDLFDVYDFDRPILTERGKVINYERVCRICGKPLLNKNGKYSYHRRYCSEHNGYELWAKYNWGMVSKSYARKVRDENKELISKNFIEYIKKNRSYYEEKPERIKNDLNYLTVCEECKKLCWIYDIHWNSLPREIGVINIHHILPVHKITMENIHLIWDYSNLKALCEDCHHKQDHQLKTKIDPFINFKRITNFI